MNIKLPNVVITGLYKDLLVITSQKPLNIGPQSREQLQEQFTNKKIKVEEEPLPLNKKWFLGDNKKNITIILRDPSAIYINDEWLATLSKLLAACNLNLGDIAIINHSQQTFAHIKEILQPQYVLMFDVTTKDIQLPFTIPHYQLQQHNGCTFMTIPVITLTAENTEAVKTEKRKLWEKMKTLFKI